MRSRNASSVMGSVTVSVRHWPPSSTAIVYARASGAGGALFFPCDLEKIPARWTSVRSRAVSAGGSASQSIETGLASPGKAAIPPSIRKSIRIRAPTSCAGDRAGVTRFNRS